jgi:hypothetical protein
MFGRVLATVSRRALNVVSLTSRLSVRAMSTVSGTERKKMENLVEVKTGPASFGDFVKFEYTNRLDNGEEIDQHEVVTQLVEGHLINGLSEALIGKKPGEIVKLTLTPEQRGDVFVEDNVQSYDVPKEMLEQFQMEVGKTSYLPSALFYGEDEDEDDDIDEEDFYKYPPIPVTLLEVTPSSTSPTDVNVKLDFNSPFHKDNFNFEIKFVENYGTNPPPSEDGEQTFLAGEDDEQYFSQDEEDYFDEEEQADKKSSAKSN